MKNLSYLLLFFLLSCGLAAVDETKARAVAEGFLNDWKFENYDSLDKYYTASFNESEPKEEKIKKLEKIKETIGQVLSFELISKKESKSMDDGPSIELKYKVNFSRTNAEQTFIIINDEGTHKITFQNIETK